MSESELKGVLIGAGYFAGIQAEAWSRIRGVKMMAVADPVTGKAADLAARHGLERTYRSVEEMFAQEQPDFVDIATRPESHLELVQLAAQHGFHVICQKPMAPAWQDCVAMCEACERAGVRLLIHENWRWQPWYRFAKKQLDQGRLGRPFQYSFFWRTADGRGSEPYPNQPYFRQMPRLLIYETLVHLLDTFRFLGGEMNVTHCRTTRLNPIIRGEDTALITTSFASGALGLIDANRHSGVNPAPVLMGTCWIEGTDGTLHIADDGQVHFAPAGATAEPLPFRQPEAGYKGDSVRLTQEHLLDCLRENRPCESEGRDYLKTVALVEEAYRLASQGLN